MNRALLVGINEYATGQNLRGCVNDVESMEALLISNGFSPMNILTLTNEQAVRKSIIDSLSLMVEHAQKGDHLVFHFSGHGSQVPDQMFSSEEADGLDEVLCPYDFDFGGIYIRDDNLRQIMVQLNADATLDVILDCCHSGTGLREPDDIIARFIPYPYETLPDGFHLFKPILRNLELPNVALWAGCQSYQTSADAHINGKYQGAMTWALCEAIQAGPIMSYPDAMSRKRVHQRLYDIIDQKFNQEPELECSDVMRSRGIFT